MQEQIAIDRKNRVVLIRLGGEITGQRIVDCGRNYLSHPDYDPEMNFIWDFSHAEKISIGIGDIGMIVDFERVHESQLGSGKRAIIFKSAVHMTLYRLYEGMQTSKRTTRAFLAMDKAADWLKQ